MWRCTNAQCGAQNSEDVYRCPRRDAIKPYSPVFQQSASSPELDPWQDVSPPATRTGNPVASHLDKFSQGQGQGQENWGGARPKVQGATASNWSGRDLEDDFSGNVRQRQQPGRYLFLLLLLRFQLYLWGSPLLGWDFCVCEHFFKIQPLRMVHAGCVFVDGIHPSRTWTSGSFWVRVMECMIAQTIPWFILSSESFFGNRVRTHVNSKGKPFYWRLRGGSNPWYCIMQAKHTTGWAISAPSGISSGDLCPIRPCL